MVGVSSRSSFCVAAQEFPHVINGTQPATVHRHNTRQLRVKLLAIRVRLEHIVPRYDGESAARIRVSEARFEAMAVGRKEEPDAVLNVDALAVCNCVRSRRKSGQAAVVS